MKGPETFVLARSIGLTVLTQALSWPCRLETFSAIRMTWSSREGPSTAARVAFGLGRIGRLAFAQDDSAFILRVSQRGNCILQRFWTNRGELDSVVSMKAYALATTLFRVVGLILFLRCLYSLGRCYFLADPHMGYIDLIDRDIFFESVLGAGVLYFGAPLFALIATWKIRE